MDQLSRLSSKQALNSCRRDEAIKLQSSSNNIYTDISETVFGDHNQIDPKIIRSIKKQYICLPIADDNIHFLKGKLDYFDDFQQHQEVLSVHIQRHCWLEREQKEEESPSSSPAKKLRSCFGVLSVLISLVFWKNYLTDAGNLPIILNVAEMKIKQSKSEHSTYASC